MKPTDARIWKAASKSKGRKMKGDGGSVGRSCITVRGRREGGEESRGKEGRHRGGIKKLELTSGERGVSKREGKEK
jgi:hypothetical protein